MAITVSRALVRLKTLDSQIRNEIIDLKPLVIAKQGKRPIAGFSSESDFQAAAIGTYDKITGLIEERKKIKAAVVASNAKTIVQIAGKRYTVAEAIERKSSLEYDSLFLRAMKEQLREVLIEIERANNELVTRRVDNYIESIYGKDGGSRDRSEEIQKMRDDYIEQNSWSLVDPLTLQKKIEAMEEDLRAFEAEVDVVLSESNATTTIEID